jgi:hypothetical protein
MEQICKTQKGHTFTHGYCCGWLGGDCGATRPFPILGTIQWPMRGAIAFWAPVELALGTAQLASKLGRLFAQHLNDALASRALDQMSARANAIVPLQSMMKQDEGIGRGQRQKPGKNFQRHLATGIGANLLKFKGISA